MLCAQASKSAASNWLPLPNTAILSSSLPSNSRTPSLRNYAFDRLSSRIKLNCRGRRRRRRSLCSPAGFPVNLSKGFEICSYISSHALLNLAFALGSNVGRKNGQKRRRNWDVHMLRHRVYCWFRVDCFSCAFLLSSFIPLKHSNTSLD